MSDIRSTFGIDGDSVDFAALEFFCHIHISDGGVADGAAFTGLVCQFFLNIGTGGFGLVLVDHRQHSAHHPLGGVIAVNVFLSGNNGDPEAFQGQPDDGILVAVTGKPVKHIDDDIFDISLGDDPVDHLPECWALIQRQRRHTGLNILTDNCFLEPSSGFLHELSLSRQ